MERVGQGRGLPEGGGGGKELPGGGVGGVIFWAPNHLEN